MYFRQCWQINSPKSCISMDSLFIYIISLFLFPEVPFCSFSVVCIRWLILHFLQFLNITPSQFVFYFVPQDYSSTTVEALTSFLITPLAIHQSSFFQTTMEDPKDFLSRYLKVVYYMEILDISCCKKCKCCALVHNMFCYPNYVLHLTCKLLLGIYWSHWRYLLSCAFVLCLQIIAVKYNPPFSYKTGTKAACVYNSLEPGLLEIILSSSPFLNQAPELCLIKMLDW